MIAKFVMVNFFLFIVFNSYLCNKRKLSRNIYFLIMMQFESKGQGD